MSSSPNRFGRQGGRGLRPWILLPKVIFVGLYLGSLAAALFGWTSSGFGALNKADPRRLWLLQQLSHLMLYVVVPCLLLALALGVALLLQHQRVLLRMRWLLVKLASLAILIPSAHLFARSRLTHLREAFAHQTTNDPARTPARLVPGRHTPGIDLGDHPRPAQTPSGPELGPRLPGRRAPGRCTTPAAGSMTPSPRRVLIPQTPNSEPLLGGLSCCQAPGYDAGSEG